MLTSKILTRAHPLDKKNLPDKIREVVPCQKKSALFIKHFSTKQNAEAASRAVASTSAKALLEGLSRGGRHLSKTEQSEEQRV
jgi:hypothetical protein